MAYELLLYHYAEFILDNILIDLSNNHGITSIYHSPQVLIPQSLGSVAMILHLLLLCSCTIV